MYKTKALRGSYEDTALEVLHGFNGEILTVGGECSQNWREERREQLQQIWQGWQKG